MEIRKHHACMHVCVFVHDGRCVFVNAMAPVRVRTSISHKEAPKLGFISFLRPIPAEAFVHDSNQEE